MDTEMFGDVKNEAGENVVGKNGILDVDALDDTQKAVRNITLASTSTLIYGGDFKDNIIAAVGDSVAAPAFNYIGHVLTGKEGLKLDQNDLSTKALITTSHALVGGTVAKLSGGEFSSGAVASAVGHVVGEYAGKELFSDYYSGNMSEKEFEDTLKALGRAVGGATVLLTQENVSDEELARATAIAESVVLNNSIDSFKEMKEVFKKYGLGGIALEAAIDGVMAGEYNPKRNSEGKVVVEDTIDAAIHYYRGNGEAVELGGYAKVAIETSPEVQRIIQKVSNGTATHLSYNGADVQLTYDGATFHIGMTNIDYRTYEDNGQWNIAFRAFSPDQDAFQDANEALIFAEDDGHGSSKEFQGGRPYNYIPYEWKVSIPEPPKKP